MLTAAVCGNIFASPSASQVRRAIDLVKNEKGTIIIVKNYTGDILNFGLAKEQYAAIHGESNTLRFVIVADDVAVGKTQGAIVGRRGLAGTVLTYKIAGALADRGDTLDNVYNVAQYVASRVGTIGVGLEHCHVPGTATTESHLDASTCEIGMGIHNEAGHRRISPIPPLRDLVSQLLDLLMSTTDPERSFLPFTGHDDVVLMINNLGGVSELELSAIVLESSHQLQSRNVRIRRVLSGSFMTSLNMPGFSITLFLLPSETDMGAPSTDLLLSLLDDRCEAPGWKWSSNSAPSALHLTKSSAVPSLPSAGKGQMLRATDTAAFTANIQKACEGLIAAEPEITRMDTIAGDGDCGLTLKAGASDILKKLADGSIDGHNVGGAMISIAQTAEEVMGGTSGALYSIFFSALAQGLQAQDREVVDHQVWANALVSALSKLYTYTLARPPSRTLVDPLAAFVESLGHGSDFRAAVKSAVEAADATKDVEAKAGRSAYLEGERLKQQKVPDPGAWGVKIILSSLDKA